MSPQHCKAKCRPLPRMSTKFIAPQQLVDGHEVAEALAHLLAFDLQEAVVHPVIRHHAGMEGAARLRDLVLVMRKHQIDAAAVDVEGLAEMLPGHGRALDVPARPARRLDAGRRW